MTIWILVSSTTEGSFYKRMMSKMYSKTESTIDIPINEWSETSGVNGVNGVKRVEWMEWMEWNEWSETSRAIGCWFARETVVFIQKCRNRLCLVSRDHRSWFRRGTWREGCRRSWRLIWHYSSRIRWLGRACHNDLDHNASRQRGANRCW
jgi:hypothetical protein